MYHSLPIYDLHRHVGGAIRPEIVWDMLRDRDIAKNLEHVYSMMTYRNDVGVRSFYRFLGKFEILNQIRWTKKYIGDIFRAIIKDARREGIKYLELRFSIDKYLKYLKIPPSEIISLIYHTTQKVAAHNGIDVRLLLGLKYEADKEQQRLCASVIDNPDVVHMLDGLDCIGDENALSEDFYIPIFKQWQKAGKLITMHLGETRPCHNLPHIVDRLNIDRIGHGIRIVEDANALAAIKERGICFEVCLTSNWITGVVQDMQQHPVRKMFDAGLKVTLGTDDPTIFGTTMNQELTIARMCLNFSDNEIETMKQNAIDYSIKHLFKDPK